MKVEVSNGNHKIGHDTLIINITSATDCPSKILGLCKIASIGGKCYAYKAEVQYPAVLPYRRRQNRVFDRVSPGEIGRQLIEKISKKRSKIRYLRVNESGDFRSHIDIKKMDIIAGMLRGIGVVTYAYTARSDLDFTKVKHMIVNGSGFMVHNSFKAVPVGYKRKKAEVNCPGNCRKCNKCKRIGNKTIVNELH